MSGRREEILETAGSMFSEQFEKSSMETAQRCEKQCSTIAENFLKALGQIMDQAVCKEDESGEDEVQYLLFSCLHSSIFLKKYFIRIDLMGPGLYMNAPLAVSYWDAGDIYGLFEKDIEEIRRKTGKRIPRLREYETDYIRYAYAPYYQRMAKAFIREMIDGLLEGSQVPERQTEEEKQVKILFGEYMGEADILFSIGREKFYEILQDICR